MQIAPTALNVLESFPDNVDNSELAEIWRETEKKVQEQNKQNVQQSRINENLRENPVSLKNENTRRVRFNYD